MDVNTILVMIQGIVLKEWRISVVSLTVCAEEALQNLTQFTAAIFLVLLPKGYIPRGLVGLSLSRWIRQYMHIPPEPPAVVEKNRPPYFWPSKGRMELKDVKIRYRLNAFTSSQKNHLHLQRRDSSMHCWKDRKCQNNAYKIFRQRDIVGFLEISVGSHFPKVEISN
ncbi:hypothetical protein Tco_1067020 [Tanacetum coccineum]|uniref:Uncharacterized protein n=1 Tax=Tanacetum coccineum TaxID=301880 RepID=A0ABQ5HC14_9ASTR